MAFLKSMPLGRFGPHPFLGFRGHSNFCILAQEGCRDYSDTLNCALYSYLFTTYEATYTLKGLFSEIWPENGFWVDKVHNFVIFGISA